MISNTQTLCSKVLPLCGINSLLRAQTQSRTKQARKTSSWICPPGQLFWNWTCRESLDGGLLWNHRFFGIPSPGSSFARRHPSWKLGHSMNRSGNFMKAMVDFQCRLLCTSHSEKDAPETLMPVPVLSDGCKHQVPHYHPKAWRQNHPKSLTLHTRWNR